MDAWIYNTLPEYLLREHVQSDRGKKDGQARVVVRITRCSTHLLDKDNLYASAIPIINSLRYSKLIADDDERTIDLQVAQIKVARRSEAGTLIEIIYDSPLEQTQPK